MDHRLDVRLSEDLPGIFKIVRTTEETQIIERRRTGERKWRSVLDRQKALFSTAAALAIDERALRLVPLPHRAPDLDGHVTRAGLELPSLARLARPEAFAGLLLDERIERPLEQLAQIAARQRVAQELARLLELLIQLGSGRSSAKLDSSVTEDGSQGP
ncbi:MAG TPA: hypothetical protein VJN18_33735 [Polyangiaceae bacterium]|nr:hypothetical protein [Polyangiaceae bacterium]